MKDDFTVESPRLNEVISRLKEFDPKVARNLRRTLRAAGDDIIAQMRARLAERPPRVGGSVKKLTRITPKNGKPYLAFRRTYQPGDVREGGVSNLRDRIAAGLSTRVTATAKREGVEIRTKGPRVGGANMARVYENKQFRHPVFGSDRYAEQFGQPYFYSSLGDEFRNRMQQRIYEAVDDAISTVERSFD